MSNYLLSKNVYFCGRGDAIIFLNLRTDEYSMITGSQAESFRRLLKPSRSLVQHVSVNDTEQNTDDPEQGCMFSELVTTEILTTDELEGKPPTPTYVERATESFTALGTPLEQTIRLNHIGNFFVACIVARVRLRFQRIEAVVRAVERRKQSKERYKSDLNITRELVSIFSKLRSLFPANYLCIFDSLALIEFLARYDLHPAWVFAVRFEPWGAHCWVQEKHVLLNEDLEEAENYTPIMAV